MSYNFPIPASQVTGLAIVATTGAYADLTGKPSIPSLANSPVWVKITKTFSDFSTAGLTNTIAIATISAKSVVSAVVLNPTVAFTGGLIAGYTISVGMNTAVDLMPASSAFTIPTGPFESNLIQAGSIGSTTAVTATATSITGLLNAAAQGSVDIYLLVSTLP